MNEKEKDMNKKMNSEAQLTTFEAISMIVGNSIGTGIIAVPYLAVQNSMWDVVWMKSLIPQLCWGEWNSWKR